MATSQWRLRKVGRAGSSARPFPAPSSLGLVKEGDGNEERRKWGWLQWSTLMRKVVVEG